MKEFYVYLHCKPDGTPFYIGKGHSKRAYQFGYRRNAYYAKVIHKYGRDNIRVCIFPCESELQAFADEVLWIRQLRDDGLPLANMTDGGEGVRGLPCSQETRKRMSAASLGKPKSAETRAKMSAAQIGNKKNAGKPMSPKAKAALIKWSTGSKHMLGYKHTPEAHVKMSLAQMGNKNGFGTKRTPESKRKMSDARKAYWARKRNRVQP